MVVAIGTKTINTIITNAGSDTKYGSPSSDKLCLVSYQTLYLTPLIVSFSTLLASLKDKIIRINAIVKKTTATIPSTIKIIDLSNLPASFAKVISPAIPLPL